MGPLVGKPFSIFLEIKRRKRKMMKYRINMAPNGVKIKKVKRRFFRG